MRPEGFRGVFRDDDLARAVYSEGAGIARELPQAVAVPADADDVASLVRWAAAERRPLIPRGSGSGMAGGAVGPGIILDLSRLLRLDPIGPTDTIWAEAGVLCGTIQDAAAAKGLRFPPDPSSSAFCTIGGMCSTNAAGPHSLAFGPTRRWVQALDCVFSDGTRAIVRRGGPAPDARPVRDFLGARESLRQIWKGAASDHSDVRKDSSGYALSAYFESSDLVDLLVGSEGTLAIIVAVELRLVPVPPATGSIMAVFRSLESAARGADAARQAGAAACELLDRTFLEFANAGPLAGTGDAAAVLLVEIEAETAENAAGTSKRLASALERSGAESVVLASTSASEKEVWELRHAASPMLSRLKHLTSMQFIEDGAVPPTMLPEYVRGIRAILERHAVTGVIFGHAGDSHVHVNPLIDVSKPDWRETVSSLLTEATALTRELRGTLAGEHGDGRLRTPLLEKVWSAAALSAFAQVKRCFDPNGILNPGVKIPTKGQQPLQSIKYDPALPPLPAAARTALDGIVARRGYSDYRLSLID